MEVALSPLVSEFGARVDIIDVDADPQLEALYNELVPVLLHEGKELCHYFLDEAKVRDCLGKIR